MSLGFTWECSDGWPGTKPDLHGFASENLEMGVAGIPSVP